MSTKGRKAYETEISKLQQQVADGRYVIRRSESAVEALSRDLLGLIRVNIFKGVYRLIRMRKQYQKVKKAANEHKDNI